MGRRCRRPILICLFYCISAIACKAAAWAVSAAEATSSPFLFTAASMLSAGPHMTLISAMFGMGCAVSAVWPMAAIISSAATSGSS